MGRICNRHACMETEHAAAAATDLAWCILAGDAAVSIHSCLCMSSWLRTFFLCLIDSITGISRAVIYVARCQRWPRRFHDAVLQGSKT